MRGLIRFTALSAILIIATIPNAFAIDEHDPVVIVYKDGHARVWRRARSRASI